MVHWAAEGFTSFSHFPTRIFFLFPISSQNIALKDYSLSFKEGLKREGFWAGNGKKGNKGKNKAKCGKRNGRMEEPL